MQTSMFAFFSLNSGILPPRRCGATEGRNHHALIFVLHLSHRNSPHGKAKAIHHPQNPLDETLTRYYRPTRLEKYGVKPYI